MGEYIVELREQVRVAVENYAGLAPAPLDESITPETFYLATPNRLAYALGWVVANQIVRARYRRSGIDALAIFHPDHGWDRFLITRRVTAKSFARQPANEFGMLMLSGDDAPRLTSPGGKTRLALGSALQADPEAAVKALLAKIPSPPLDTDDSNRLLKPERAPRYPDFYNAVTELILEHPGLVAAREIYIDDEQIDGKFHPLYLHAAEPISAGPGDSPAMNVATMTYRWFQLQYGDLFTYFDRRGNRAIIRTDRNTWARTRKQLQYDPDEDIKPRIAGWLRLGGRTLDPERD